METPKMETGMNRPILVCVLFAAATAALGAQEARPSNPYQGTSNPPADDMIVTTSTPQAKPPAGQPMSAQPSAPSPAQAAAQSQAGPQPASADPSIKYPVSGADGTDDGIVLGSPQAPAQPVLVERAFHDEPDGDIVHPHPPRPGELGEGTTIRVRLLDRLSTASSRKGETFSSRVASDVLQGGQVLIPAGAEIDGSVADVSSGHPGGHGTMRLRPETVTLPDGTRYRLYAEVTGAPGSRTKVGDEGTIRPDSRLKRDGIEYGGAVGAGAAAGAMLGGPVGAVTGGLIGAGAVTAHLLISHPQATLEPGAVLLFTLSEPLQMVPASASGN
jgi:hypothetical protein